MDNILDVLYRVKLHLDNQPKVVTTIEALIHQLEKKYSLETRERLCERSFSQTVDSRAYNQPTD